MRCMRAKWMFGAYVAGELSERKRKALEEHLRKCPRCAAELEDWKAARNALEVYGKREVPTSTWKGYWETIRDRAVLSDEVEDSRPAGVREAFWHRAVVLVLTAACVIAVVLAAKTLHNNGLAPRRDADVRIADSTGSAGAKGTLPEVRQEFLPSRTYASTLLRHHPGGYGVTTVRLASSDESDFCY